MFRSLFSVTAIFAFLFAIAAFPVNVSARRCEDVPETLLSLYRRSKAIYVAEFDRKADLGIKEEDDHFAITSTRRYFNVVSTLKGENRRAIQLDGAEYREKQPIQRDSDPSDDFDEFTGEPILKSGDVVLLFLAHNEAGDGFDVAAYGGMKRVSESAISTYRSKISELNSIFSGEKADDARIVEFLVSSVEDPVTRWDGAFELLRSYDAAVWEEDRQKEIREKLARGEKIEDEPEVEEGSDMPTPTFSRLLNQAQKQRIADVLLAAGREVSKAEGADPHIADADALLIDLVGRFGDSRLPGFLVQRLRTDPADVYQQSYLMSVIVRSVDDSRLKSLSSKFSDIAYEDAMAYVNREDFLKYAPDSLRTAETAEGKIPTITFAGLRERLLTDFLSRAEMAIFERQSAGAPTGR